MEVFRPIPLDVMQIGEKTAVDLFILHEGRHMPFLGIGGVFTREHLAELSRFGITKVYIRGGDARTFEKYVHDFSEMILNDPTIPPRVKEATFYVSASHALRKAMIDPGQERFEEIRKTIMPMLRNIMVNKVLLNDLFSITEHDFITYTHSINVGIYATALVMNLHGGENPASMESLERQCYGYFLHDIGKCMMPLSILKKPGKLSEEEWVVMRKHPQWGYAILMETGFLTDEAAYISMQHHERPDGSGYPFGMTDIHPCARVCAFADIFDALISDRPYKSPMKPLDAIEILKKEVYTDFDRTLVDAFTRMPGLNGEQVRLPRAAAGM